MNSIVNKLFACLVALIVITAGAPVSAAIHEVAFNDGTKALVDLPDKWSVNPDGTCLVYEGRIRMCSNTANHGGMTTCEWLQGAARFMDSPRDDSITVSTVSLDVKELVGGGARAACRARIIAPRLNADFYRIAYLVNEKIYTLVTRPLIWKKDLDTYSISGFEGDVSIIASRMAFQGSPNYSDLAAGVVPPPPAPAEEPEPVMGTTQDQPAPETVEAPPAEMEPAPAEQPESEMMAAAPEETDESFVEPSEPMEPAQPEIPAEPELTPEQPEVTAEPQQPQEIEQPEQPAEPDLTAGEITDGASLGREAEPVEEEPAEQPAADEMVEPVDTASADIPTPQPEEPAEPEMAQASEEPAQPEAQAETPEPMPTEPAEPEVTTAEPEPEPVPEPEPAPVVADEQPVAEPVETMEPAPVEQPEHPGDDVVALAPPQTSAPEPAPARYLQPQANRPDYKEIKDRVDRMGQARSLDRSEYIENIYKVLLLKKFDEAEKAFNEMLKSFPYDANMGLGDLEMSRRGLPDTAKAKMYYEKAMDIDPDQPGAYNGLGIVAQSGGDLLEAEKMFMRAYAIDPGDPATLTNLGVLAFQTGHLFDAEKNFYEAMARNPTVDVADAALNGLTYVWLQYGEFKAIREWNERMVEMIFPESPVAHANLLTAYLALGETEKAENEEAYLKRVLPENYQRDLIGQAYLNAGKTQQAVATLCSGIDADMTAANYVYCAQSLKSLGRTDAAIESLLKATGKADATVEVYMMCAREQEAAGNLKGAIRTLVLGQASFEHSIEIKLEMERLKKKAGQ